jgi:hypothetical protein
MTKRHADDVTIDYIIRLRKLEQENERLREALRKADACLDDTEVGWYERIEDAQCIIFDALKEGE